MVRLARGNETLLHPFVDSKGNFGKVYSRDMAMRRRVTRRPNWTPSAELFRDIDADTVDFVDNYDGSMKEPTLLPTFPECAGLGQHGHCGRHGVQHLLV